MNLIEIFPRKLSPKASKILRDPQRSEELNLAIKKDRKELNGEAKKAEGISVHVKKVGYRTY
jgi:hypothetical protein